MFCYLLGCIQFFPSFMMAWLFICLQFTSVSDILHLFDIILHSIVDVFLLGYEIIRDTQNLVSQPTDASEAITVSFEIVRINPWDDIAQLLHCAGL